MPVSSGAAVFVASLIPAALFFTVNYIGGDNNNNGNSSNSSSFSNLSKFPQINYSVQDEISSEVSPEVLSTTSESIFDDPFFKEDLKDSSVVKKSVKGIPINYDLLPKLSTCCDLSLLKLEDGSQRMSYCDSPGDTIIKSPAGVFWDVPKHLSYRNKPGLMFR